MRRRESGIVLTSNVLGGTNPPIPLVREFPETPKSERMRHFYVADNGVKADPPRWLKQSQEKLVRIQKKLNRMEPGSKNYQQAVQKYRLLHERVANQRRDFLHKESSRIANGWDAVCMRADEMQNLSKITTRGNVMESGFGTFREMLRYKLEQQGKPLLLVDRYAATTRTCSVCGQVQDGVSRKLRTWTCPKCGTVHHREVNAAKNIKEEGLAQLSA